MVTNNKNVLDECLQIINTKINKYNGYIKSIDHGQNGIIFLMNDEQSDGIFTKEDLRRSEFIKEKEEEILKKCKYALKQYEDLKEVLENKVRNKK